MSLVVKKNTIVVFLMLIACLFLRPAALGEKYNTIAVGILFVAAVIQYLYTRYIDRYAMKICVYIWIFWLYIAFQSLVLADDSVNISAMINTVISNVIVSLSFAVLLSEKSIKESFLRKAIIAFSLLALSYLITLAITFLINNLDSLYLFQIKYAEHSYSTFGRVYFPFTVTYNRYMLFGREIRRFLSIFRECGILPVFYTYAFYQVSEVFKNKKAILFYRIMLVLGVVFSFSFAGYIAFGASVFFYFSFKKGKMKNTVFLLLAVALGVAIMSTISDMSFAGKTLSGSLTDRMEFLPLLMDQLKNDFFFGTGYANNEGSWTIHINFIGTMTKIGAVGTVLYFLPFFANLFKSPEKKYYLASMSAFLIITLFAQPIASQNLSNIFWFLFIPYLNESSKENGEKLVESTNKNN